MMLVAGSSSRSTSNRFRHYLHVQCGYAGEVAARSAQTGDQPYLDRVGSQP